MIVKHVAQEIAPPWGWGWGEDADARAHAQTHAWARARAHTRTHTVNPSKYETSQCSKKINKQEIYLPGHPLGSDEARSRAGGLEERRPPGLDQASASAPPRYKADFVEGPPPRAPMLGAALGRTSGLVTHYRHLGNVNILE